MFQATRNWTGISSLIGGMKTHLSQLPHRGQGVDLINNLGEPIENYDIVFRELFCVAALALADRLGQRLTSVGVLWDEILPTGQGTAQYEPASTNKDSATRPGSDSVVVDLVEKGALPRRQGHGCGSLMILARRVRNDRDADQLASAGYRFAELRQVSGLIKSVMQIQTADIESTFRDIATYANELGEPYSRVSVGLFGIKARVDNSGFDVLVRKRAKNMLPSASLPIDALEQWHLKYLRQFGNMSVSEMLQALPGVTSDNATPKERVFATYLTNTIKDLRKVVQDPLFDEAIFTPTPVSVPCMDQSGIETTTKLLAFQLMVPIHTIMDSPSCEFINLDFFKVRQLSQKQQLDFMQGVHRELGPIIKTLSDRAAQRSGKELRPWLKPWRRGSLGSAVWATNPSLEAQRQHSSHGSILSSSTLDLYSRRKGRSMSSNSEETAELSSNGATINFTPQPLSGILVSQEITVDDSAEKPDTGTDGYPHPLDTGKLPRRSMTSRGRKDSSTLGVEMRPMTQRAGANVIGGQHPDLGGPATFVDILFTQYIMTCDNIREG